MSWIDEALAANAAEILEAATGFALEGGLSKDSAVTFDETMGQVEKTLEMLIASPGRGGSALMEQWEEFGRGLADREVPLSEVPNAPEYLKRAIWKVLEAPVAAGEVGLRVLVDSMMDIESVLGDCWLSLVRACLAAGRDSVRPQGSESRLERMAASGLFSRALPSHLDQREQMRSLLEIATALAKAECGLVMLPSEETGRLEIAERTGPALGHGGDEALVEIARRAFETGEPQLFCSSRKDPAFGGLETGEMSCMIAPLNVRDTTVGILGVAATEGGRYGDDDLELFDGFAGQAAIAIENTQLYERLQDTYLGTIGSLAAAIEARDPYTVGHSARVTKYAVAIAQKMGLPADRVEELRLAGLLHDLGKIGVPDSILNKPGRLTEEEYQVIKLHPALSMRIIEPLPHLGSIIPIIYNHHEHFDGSGYMEGRAGDMIPLGARIISVADAYEAMTSDRPYRTALTREEAIAELQRNAGSQFDPEIVACFVELLESTARRLME